MRLRAGRIAGALGLVAVLSAAGAGRAADEHDYVGQAKCKTCHGKELIGNQLATWRTGSHARAFETLKSAESQAIAEARGIVGPAHEAADCLSCHATAYGVPPARMAYDLELSDGVQCESCHGPGRDYRKKKIMSDEELAHAKGLWHAEDAAICTTCHNEQSPTHDPTRYTLPDGGQTGFDPVQARARILHAIPEDVKGRYIELEKKQREAKKAAGGG